MSEDVKVGGKKINSCIASKCLMEKWIAKIRQVLQAGKI
jgi:hypothetical protein